MMSSYRPKWFDSSTGNIDIRKLANDFIAKKESRKGHLQDL